MPDDDRITPEEIDEAGVGYTGKERQRMVAVAAENRAFALGWRARLAAEAEEADEDPMVQCPGCNGTGKMWGYGDQCRRCYGATTIKASLLEPDEETLENGHRN